MKLLVAVKRVVDFNVRVRVRADGGGVDLTDVRMAMNPFDEIALEEALRIREAGRAAEVVAVSAGPAEAADTLRTAIAMGADRGILVRAEGRLEPLAVARLLAALAAREAPGLILLGKQAIDDDCNQTGQMLSALLGWPQATFASRIDHDADALRVTCEVDGGRETLALSLPAVVTADLRLNEPRYVSLPNLMRARRKPIEELTPAALAVDVAPRLVVRRVEEPPARRAGVRVASAAELVERLRTEAGVL